MIEIYDLNNIIQLNIKGGTKKMVFSIGKEVNYDYNGYLE